MRVTKSNLHGSQDQAFGADRVTAILRDVVVEAHVGLHPWERHPERPSRLVVNVEMSAPAGPGRLDRVGGPFLDYDPVREALRGWSGRAHTPLLETLVEELFEVCFRNPAVETCRISVMKPDIFNEAAAVGVEATRHRAPAAGAPPQ